MSEKTEQNLDEAIFAGADREDLENYDEGDRGDTVRPAGEGEERAAEPETPPEPAEEPPPEEPPPAAQPEEPAEEPARSEPPKGEQRIPKARFDEVNERRKAAEARLAEYERAQKAGEQHAQFDFEAKEKEYLEAVLDGETDKAMALRREIRSAERESWQAQMAETASRTRETTKAELALTTAVNELQDRYPVFDANSERFDEGLTQEALDLFEGFKVRGYEPAAAMRKAVGYVAAANSLDGGEEPAEQPQGKAGEPRQQASQAQVQKKLEAATKQPPQPNGAPPESPKDVMRMSEDEFDKLSEAELRRLRGDLV